MRIVHIITGLEDGGAEATLYNFVNNSDANKHFIISLRGEGKYGKKLRNKGFELFCINLSLNFSFLKKIINLAKIIKMHDPDIIQTWMYHANLIGGITSYLVNKRNIVWGIHHSTLSPKLNKKTTIIIAKLNGLFSHIVPKKIIMCAEKSKIEHLKYGFNERKILIINNGIDTKKFKRSFELRRRYREKLNINIKENLYGTVARYDPNKDHITLFKTINLIKKTGLKFKYLLVGKNIDKKNFLLKRLIKKYNLQDIIILKGIENDICAVMNAIDLHITSSLSEAFPLVVLESMACGTICISTDVGDVKDILKNKKFISKIEDENSLFKSFQEFNKLSMKEKNTISITNEKIIDKDFSIKKMSDSYLKIYKDLI